MAVSESSFVMKPSLVAKPSFAARPSATATAATEEFWKLVLERWRELEMCSRNDSVLKELNSIKI